MTSAHGDRYEIQAEDYESRSTLHDSELSTARSLPLSSLAPITSQKDVETEGTTKSFGSNGTVYEINMRELPFQLTEEKNVFSGASLKEISMLCDVAAAYSTTCSRHKIDLTLPPLCGKVVF